MNKEYEQKAVLGIVMRSDEVLLVKRKKVEVGRGGLRLEWGFPGGKIEEGETQEQAVVREVYEETGYHVLVDRLISKRNHPDFPVEVFYFSCSFAKEDNDNVKDANTDQYKWIPIIEITEYLTSDLDLGVKEHLSIV